MLKEEKRARKTKWDSFLANDNPKYIIKEDEAVETRK